MAKSGVSIGVWLAVAAVVTVGLLYFLFDPAESALAPKCVFHALTGWDCPGCGSQRMLHALLHGDMAGAWHANPFLLCAMPLLILLAFATLYRKRWPRLYRTVNSMPVIIAVSVAIIAWTIVRNCA